MSPEGRNLEWGGSGRSHSRSGAVGVQVGVDRFSSWLKGEVKPSSVRSRLAGSDRVWWFLLGLWRTHWGELCQTMGRK